MNGIVHVDVGRCDNCSCHPHGEVRLCDGCRQWMCVPCWLEHNEDAACHDPESHGDGGHETAVTS